MPGKLQLGIIGMGMGMSHLDALQGHVAADVAAICDHDAAWLAHVQETHHISTAYTDYRKLLAAPGIDAVVVALPSALHAETTVAALQAGKHVLCEKPMALNAADAKAMMRAARDAERKLMIGHHMRFSEWGQFLRRCVDEGHFGDIYLARAGWRRPMGVFPSPTSERATGQYSRNWFNQRTKGGGVLRDLGSHLVDLSLWVMDFPTVDRVVSANHANFTPTIAAAHGEQANAEDSAAGMVRFANGSGLLLEVTFGAFVAKEEVYFDFYGTRGGASARDWAITLFGKQAGAYTSVTPRLGGYPVESMHDNFIRAIRENCDPLVTGEHGVAVTSVLDALYADGIVVREPATR